jgi:hypothetical protein
MIINIVNYEMNFNNGILTKFANKISEELTKVNICHYINNIPLNNVDINHHINYLQYPKFSHLCKNSINTLMITHIWEGEKLEAVREGMKTTFGICMSNETKNYLVNKGIDKDRLTVILSGHDLLPRKKIKVAICTNVYPDGCKREQMFYDLLHFLREYNIFDCFKFTIMGRGWNIDKTKFDYCDSFIPQLYLNILDTNDFMLYFGKDEGACSILDAKQVGLKIIAPLTGFHREIGIDFKFDTQDQLNDIFKKLSFNNVEKLTWENYTKKHLKLWEQLLKK